MKPFRTVTIVTILLMLAIVLGVSYTSSVRAQSLDFSLSNSGPIHAFQGGSGSNEITVTLVGGSPQNVVLSCADGLPSDVFCFFHPGAGLSTYSSTLVVAAASSASVGRYTVTVLGYGGTQSHSTQFTLIITPAPAVGGTSLAIDKVGLAMPYIGVAILVIGATAATVLIIRNRRVTRSDQTFA